MKSRSQMGLAAVVALCTAAGSAGAEDAAPLSAAELARCASQVQQLRGESVRILAENARLDTQRAGIEARRREIKDDAITRPRGDLAAGLELSERRQNLNAEATAFNGRIARIRSDIAAINEVKAAYESGCAQRPYRRRDLEQLPQAAQDAMRAGLADVEVPYTDKLTPLPSDGAQAGTE